MAYDLAESFGADWKARADANASSGSGAPLVSANGLQLQANYIAGPGASASANDFDPFNRQVGSYTVFNQADVGKNDFDNEIFAPDGRYAGTYKGNNSLTARDIATAIAVVVGGMFGGGYIAGLTEAGAGVAAEAVGAAAVGEGIAPSVALESVGSVGSTAVTGVEAGNVAAGIAGSGSLGSLSLSNAGTVLSGVKTAAGFLGASGNPAHSAAGSPVVRYVSPTTGGQIVQPIIVQQPGQITERQIAVPETAPQFVGPPAEAQSITPLLIVAAVLLASHFAGA